MSLFHCIASSSGTARAEQNGADERLRALAGSPPTRLLSPDGAFVAYTAAGSEYDQTLTHVGARYIGVGDVRLDNRADVLGIIGSCPVHVSDMELCVRFVESQGLKGIIGLQGDFAIVLWDCIERSVVVLRDALGTRPLFVSSTSDTFSVASRASLLIDGAHAYDREYIATWIVGGASSLDRTIFSGVSWVPAGHTVRWHDGVRSVSSFWSPHDVGAEHRITFADATDEFQRLFVASLKFNLSGRRDTWSELSGGLDSSSVVSMVQFLHETGSIQEGLAGTITVYDELGDGDERTFSEEVVRRYRVRNIQRQAGWMWKDFAGTPPLTDLPSPSYPLVMYANASGELIRQHGGRIILTGQGADYLMGRENSMVFLADLLAKGRLIECVHEAFRWSVVRRSSLWSTLWSAAVYPLLPTKTRLKHRTVESIVPRWVAPAFRNEFDLDAFTLDAVRYVTPLGRKYRSMIAQQVSRFSTDLYPDMVGNGIVIRHPFMHRRLVEFLLRLPARYLVQPRAAKFVMRHALDGILPDKIRQRVSKGGASARQYWSLTQESDRLRQLFDDPILCQLGVVDARLLRRDWRRARLGKLPFYAPLLNILALETWLRVQQGRWQEDPNRKAPAFVNTARVASA